MKHCRASPPEERRNDLRCAVRLTRDAVHRGDAPPSQRGIRAANRDCRQTGRLNLVRNAIDAMAGVDGRARVLTASSKVVDVYASVAIADTGVGIDPASTARLFDALHDQGRGARSVDLPQNYNCPRRTFRGGEKRHARCDVHFGSPSSPIRPIAREKLIMSLSAFVHIVDDDKAVREGGFGRSVCD